MIIKLILIIIFVLLVTALGMGLTDAYILDPLREKREKKHFEKIKKQGLLKTKEDYKQEVETWEEFKDEVKKMVEDCKKKDLPISEIKIPYYKYLRILSFRTVNCFFPYF